MIEDNQSFESEFNDIIEAAVADAYEYGQDERVPIIRAFKDKVLSKQRVRDALEDDALIILGIMSAEQHREFMKYCKERGII